jgi:hypothetical protein
MSLLVATNTPRFQNWNAETPQTRVGQKRKRLTKSGDDASLPQVLCGTKAMEWPGLYETSATKRRKITSATLNVDFLNCCYDPIVANVVQRLDINSLLSLGCASKLWQIVTTASHGLWSSLAYPMKPHINNEKRFCVQMRKELSRDVVVDGDFIHASFLRTRPKLYVVSRCNGELVVDAIPMVRGEEQHITFILPGVNARADDIVSACFSENGSFIALLRHNGEVILVNLACGKVTTIPTTIRLYNTCKLPMFFHHSHLVIVDHREDSNIIRFLAMDCQNEEPDFVESITTTNVSLSAITCRSDDNSLIVGVGCVKGSAEVLLFCATLDDKLSLRYNVVTPKFPVEVPDFFTDRLSRIATTQSNLYCVCIFGAPIWFDSALQLSQRSDCPYFEKSPINAATLNQHQVFSDCLVSIDKVTRAYVPKQDSIFDVHVLGSPFSAPKHTYRENYYYDNAGSNGRVISVHPHTNKKQTTVRLRTFSG